MSSLLNYAMPVREVLDRDPSVFRHDVQSLRDNAFATIITGSLGEIGLVSKARSYSSTPYDVMVTSLEETVSSLGDLSAEQRTEFFEIVSDVSDALMTISGLRIVTGLNQHPKSYLLPERDIDGRKTRVQTLRPLHAHIYEIDVYSGKKITFRDLPVEDQRDIRDPFIRLSGDIVTQALREKLGIHAWSSPIVPPWGIHVPASLEDLAAIQACLEAEYIKWHDIVVSGSTRDMKDTSPYAKRAIQLISTMLKETDQAAPYSIFTNGFAVTYSIQKNTGEEDVVVIHPRLMSKGNSPDAMGIYVADSIGETHQDRENKRKVYAQIIHSLVTKYTIASGNFMDNKEMA